MHDAALNRISLCFCVFLCQSGEASQPVSSLTSVQSAACVRLPSSPGPLHLCVWPSGAVALCMCKAAGWIKDKCGETLVRKKEVSEVRDMQSQNERCSTLPCANVCCAFSTTQSSFLWWHIEQWYRAIYTIETPCPETVVGCGSVLILNSQYIYSIHRKGNHQALMSNNYKLNNNTFFTVLMFEVRNMPSQNFFPR